MEITKEIELLKAGMYTTLNKIRRHSPCSSGWAKLLKHLDKIEADDEPLSFLTILESNGVDDAVWCCRSAPEYDKEWRLFAVWCGRQVQHLMTDERSVAALNVADQFANGLATKEELDAAATAAYNAAGVASADAYNAARAVRGVRGVRAAGVARADAYNAARATRAVRGVRGAQKEQFVKVIATKDETIGETK